MGKIKKGILGGFSGRVGNVIGGSWKGIDYMRSEATSIADPKTPKQLAQRSKFRVAVEFAKQVVPLINIGLKQYATKRSEFNYLVSRICKDWWDDANDNIDFSRVQLSAGSLPTEDITFLDYGSTPMGGSFNVNHTTEHEDYYTNTAYCAVYDTTTGLAYLCRIPSQYYRDDEGCEIEAQGRFDLTKCWSFLFFYDETTGECSPTTAHYGE